MMREAYRGGRKITDNAAACPGDDPSKAFEK
jgi:hypothetical protein